METDPLQQLRDIHLPPDPGWWPPAIGWWILALLCIAIVYWLSLTLVAAWRKRAPIRAARRLYRGLYQRLKDEEIDAQSYCHQCNELLKRLLVHGLGRRDLGAEVDQKWLSALDEISGDASFSSGPGAILGAARFRRDPQIDIDGLHRVMCKLLKAVKP